MKLRAYFFGNMYISSIQQGIQAGHAIADMAVKYRLDEDILQEQSEMFIDWAKNHKVMILLNAGYAEVLEDFGSFFEGINDNGDDPRMAEFYDGYSPYPFTLFHESDEALNGAPTSFCVILPDKIYDGQNIMRKVKRMRPDMYPRQRFEKERILTFPDGTEHQYNEWEVFFMSNLGRYGMAK